MINKYYTSFFLQLLYHIFKPKLSWICETFEILSSGTIRVLLYFLTEKRTLKTTSGKVEIRAYGKQPVFPTSSSSTGGDFTNNSSLIDINGGQSFTSEWDDIHTPLGNIGVIYYRSTPKIEIIWNFIVFQLLPFIGIAIIVIIVIVTKKRNKREFKE